MNLLYLLGLALTIWAGVDAVRQGRMFPWLWIILFFPPLGAVIYLVVAHGAGALRGLRLPTLPGPSARDLERAAAEVRRLDTAVAWQEYATLLRRKRRFTAAAEAARQALQRDAQDLAARYELGLSLLGAGEAAAAAPELAAVVERDSDLELGEAAAALARAQAESGDLAGAQATLAGLTVRRSAPQFLWQLAGVEAARGDRAAAAAALRRILDDAAYVPAYHRRQVAPWVRRARKMLQKLES